MLFPNYYLNAVLYLPYPTKNLKRAFYYLKSNKFIKKMIGYIPPFLNVALPRD
jgi:hypothetical protein